MRTPLVVTSMLLGLVLGATATPTIEKKAYAYFDELTEGILDLFGSHTLTADEDGKIPFTMEIGGKNYDFEAHVGLEGSMKLTLEEMKDLSGKTVNTVVIWFDRPDGDNASIMFSGLAPKLKQVPFIAENVPGFGGAVYTGNLVCGQVVDSGISNRFSHDGANGAEKQTGPFFYVQPKYDDGTNTAQGTRGIFISPNPLPVGFGTEGRVGIVIGLAEWEQ